jgi:hypothetical protein
MATKRPPDSQPLVNHGGRLLALKLEHIAVLRAIVTERAQVSLQEIADELHQCCVVLVYAAPSAGHCLPKTSYGSSRYDGCT